MRCIIMGGGGFLGSHLCEELLSCGHEVVIFEKGPPRAGMKYLLDKVKWVEGDFFNPQHVGQVLANADILFHLISTTAPQTSNNDMVFDIETNVVATLNMLQLAKKTQIKKVVYFSSGGTIYGKPKLLPIREDHPNDPICSYGIHKLAIEKYLHLFFHLYGLDYGILRIANPYGPRQLPTGGQGVIAAFIDRVLNNQPVGIWGDGSVVRDYIYVKDVAKAAAAILEYKGAHKIFNIGSGEGHSLTEIVQNIQSIIKKPVKIDYMPARPSDVPVNILDIQRAKEELCWQPSVNFSSGLAATIEFMSGKRKYMESDTHEND